MFVANAAGQERLEGTINTEQAFERGLRYMVDGMKLSLAAKG